MVLKSILKMLYTTPNASLSEISNYLGIKDDKDLKSFLIELVQKRLLTINSDKTYSLNLERNEIAGIFRGNEKGFGFISPLDNSKDCYVYHSNQKGAIDGDLVIGVVTRKANGDKKAEAKVVKVLTPASEKYVGTFHEIGVNGQITFENRVITKTVFVSKKARNGASDGDKVIFKISDRESKEKEMKGTVIEILGHKDEKGIDITTSVREKGIPIHFSTETMNSLEHFPTEVQEKELKGRLDLRNELIITIDGEDSKDLDDAISLEQLPNGNYYLGVHIADVAHYVTEDSPVDRDAVERATSVYLVDRVIPMLPKQLSNGICSLHPAVDRLTLTCFMEVNEVGDVVNHKVAETVINSKARMTYTNVKNILHGDESLREEYAHVVPLLEQMEVLAKILMRKRDQRGSIDFDMRETKVILDENNKPIDIKAYDRNIATRIIEEFMILANETVAEKFNKLKVPFVYRVHAHPEGQKMQLLKQFLTTMGVFLPSQGVMKPLDLQTVLKEYKGTSEEFAINHIMLRSLPKARYDVKNIEHFGLASKFYSHFTSPIRRYPDLQIHRIIKEYLHGNLKEARIEHYDSILKLVTDNSSQREIKAQEAERDSVEMKKCEFMLDKVGQEYEGLVVGITDYGLYIELENTVDGLLHVSKLKDDYYMFDEENYCLVGEQTSKKFKLGDKLNVKLVRVNVEKREIDFDLVKDVPNEEEV